MQLLRGPVGLDHQQPGVVVAARERVEPVERPVELVELRPGESRTGGRLVVAVLEQPVAQLVDHESDLTTRSRSARIGMLYSPGTKRACSCGSISFQRASRDGIGGQHPRAHLLEAVEREAQLVLDCADVLEAVRLRHRLLGDGAHLGLVVDGAHQLEVRALGLGLDDEDLVADDAVQLGERGVRIGDVVQALEQHGDVDALVWQRDLLRAAFEVAAVGVDRRSRG